MRVLVTGGAGYLGSVLSPLLIRGGHQVRVLDDLSHGGAGVLALLSEENFRFQRGDIRSIDTVREAVKGCDGVVHLASIVGDPACARQPDLARQVNIESSLRLFEIASRLGVGRFIFASTCSNYGKMADGSGELDENAELRPVSLYAETKVAVERTILDAPAGAPAVTVLRCATLYGLSPRMRFDLTVNEFTRDLFVRRKLVLFGRQFWRPYVHVRDAARAIEKVLAAPLETVATKVFNVGDSTQNFQKGQIVDLVLEQIDGEVEIEQVSKLEDPRDYRVRFDRIRDDLGFRITRTVPDGIREVMDAICQGVIPDHEDARYRN
jgi:nucleoside-diphosphate-sugar epimerase